MTELLLTEEQSKFLSAIRQPIPVRDTAGNVIGHFDPQFSAEFIAELKRRAESKGPWYTGQQVQNRLATLQAEWDRRGGFDEETMHQILKDLDGTDPGRMKAQGNELFG